MTTRKPAVRKPAVDHGVVHDQVHPCACGTWFSSPTDLQGHVDTLKKS